MEWRRCSAYSSGVCPPRRDEGQRSLATPLRGSGRIALLAIVVYTPAWSSSCGVVPSEHEKKAPKSTASLPAVYT